MCCDQPGVTLSDLNCLVLPGEGAEQPSPDRKPGVGCTGPAERGPRVGSQAAVELSTAGPSSGGWAGRVHSGPGQRSAPHSHSQGSLLFRSQRCRDPWGVRCAHAMHPVVFAQATLGPAHIPGGRTVQQVVTLELPCPQSATPAECQAASGDE